MPRTQREDLAWTAGMFEGEGSIRITKPRETRRSELRCELSSTGEEIIRYFQENWRGSVNPAYGLESNRKPQLRWVASGRNAYNFLREVLPFLKTKRMQKKAHLGLAFYLDPDNVAYYERLTQLNAKGVAVVVAGSVKRTRRPS